MNKGMVGVALVALGLSWSASAVAASQPAQPPKATQPAQPAQPQLSGDGWRLVRAIQLGTTNRHINMVLVDKKRDSDKAIYNAAVNKICGGEPDYCKIKFWSEERHVPTAISLTRAQFETMRADYSFDRAGELREMLWSCSIESDKSQCFTP